jgi:hypothetical protein
MTMQSITVVGGGLAGLVCAIRAAELGSAVDLYEADRRVGGRGRGSAQPYIAHEGPHVIYADGDMWAWLARRDLLGPYRRLSGSELAASYVRHHGRRRRVPPAKLLGLLARRGQHAPVDRDFTSWVAERHGAETARLAANLSGVATFDADPGRLSAAFVWERLVRVFAQWPPQVRYLERGWSSLIGRLEARARTLAVRIHTDTRVDEVPQAPTVVATSLPAARKLLGDSTLQWPSGSTVLLDVATERRRDDAFIMSDLDEAGWFEDFSRPSPALAPAGHSLVQAQMPIRTGERRDEAIRRLEGLVELAMPGFRQRTRWRRIATAHGRTGALDLPGRTWRDRPAIDRGDGIFLAGDSVAAPGLLGEVAWCSGVWAAEAAVRALTGVTGRGATLTAAGG